MTIEFWSQCRIFRCGIILGAKMLIFHLFYKQNCDFSTKMLIFHGFYKHNGDFSTKMLIFHRFYKGWRKKNSVAAAPLVERPPFSSHSNIFFENDVKTNGFSNILRVRRGALGQRTFTNPLMRQNPYSQRPVWGIKRPQPP